MDRMIQDLRAFLKAHARPLSLAGIACLLLAWLCLEESPRYAAPPARSEAAQTHAEQESQARRTTILGETSARSAQPLTNPFSLRHETRETASAAPPPGAVPDKGAPPARPGPAVPATEVQAAAPPAPSPQPLALKGITRSQEAACASIADGAQTHLLFVGDTIGDYTLSAIDEHAVTLTSDRATLILRLPGY